MKDAPNLRKNPKRRDVVERRVTIAVKGFVGCRWPVEQHGRIEYCGGGQARGSIYCDAHKHHDRDLADAEAAEARR